MAVAVDGDRERGRRMISEVGLLTYAKGPFERGGHP